MAILQLGHSRYPEGRPHLSSCDNISVYLVNLLLGHVTSPMIVLMTFANYRDSTDHSRLSDDIRWDAGTKTLLNVSSRQTIITVLMSHQIRSICPIDGSVRARFSSSVNKRPSRRPRIRDVTTDMRFSLQFVDRISTPKRVESLPEAQL